MSVQRIHLHLSKESLSFGRQLARAKKTSISKLVEGFSWADAIMSAAASRSRNAGRAGWRCARLKNQTAGNAAGQKILVKILLDCDVLLDVMAGREKFLADSARVLDCCETGEIHGPLRGTRWQTLITLPMTAKQL